MRLAAFLKWFYQIYDMSIGKYMNLNEWFYFKSASNKKSK